MNPRLKFRLRRREKFRGRERLRSKHYYEYLQKNDLKRIDEKYGVKT